MLRKVFFQAIAAGGMVAIGGAVYMACDDKVVGAVLFSVALLTICALGMYLYTGKIGFLAEDFQKKEIAALLAGVLGNYIGATGFGLLLGAVRPDLRQKAATLCETKLQYSAFSVLVLGFFCGILMYAAVKIYKEKKTFLGILFCIPVFILCGFEHSIADMFYAAMAGNVIDMILPILIITLGNAIGGNLIPVILRLTKATNQ